MPRPRSSRATTGRKLRRTRPTPLPIFPHKESALPGALAGLFVRGRFGGLNWRPHLAAAFCCRILRSAAQEGRKGFFLCGKLVCGFLREACAQDSAGGARVAFFSRGLLGGAFLRELFFAFYAQTRRNFLGGLASLRRRRFFCLALPIARLSAWRVCAMRLAERKDLRADFFLRDFFAPCASGAMNLGGILI